MPPSRPAGARGYTLIEVLVTFIVLAAGLLGLAQLLTKMHQAEVESYQRAQAVLLMQDMAARVAVAGWLNAPNYTTGTSSPLGDPKDGQPTSCTALSGNQYDWCIWSNALKGAAETSGSNNVGAMIGARGCIEQLQAPDTNANACAPGIYRVSVVWQGLTPTVAPSNLACGQNLYGTGASQDNLRRAVSTKVTVGTPTC